MAEWTIKVTDRKPSGSTIKVSYKIYDGSDSEWSSDKFTMDLDYTENSLKKKLYNLLTEAEESGKMKSNIDNKKLKGSDLI